MPSSHRSARVLAVTLFAVLLVAVPAAAAHPSAATPAQGSAMSIADAEGLVLDLINARRDAKGLRPLRLDSRVGKVARARSQDMIDRHYFAHQDPDGKDSSDYLRKAGVKYTRSSEIIAWNHSSDLEAGARQVVSVWMSDSIHRHEVLSTTHNYFGAGIATDGSKVIWTVDSITGPDRTDPTARITSATWSGGKARLTWTGADPKLQAGTAGLRDYDLARRSPGGGWVTIRSHTTRTSTASTSPNGSEFRVRARDKAGNVGAWSAAVSAH